MSETERERIVEELRSIIQQANMVPESVPGCIVDFIIEDRKRIVDPLVKYKKKNIEIYGLGGCNLSSLTIENVVIDETLKLAGIDEGK